MDIKNLFGSGKTEEKKAPSIMEILGFGKKQPEEKKVEKKGGYKIAVSSGLYTIARSEELQTLVKKVGYALTRGSAVIEISSDIPHEIDYSEGKEIRYIAEHQGIELTLHGDLAVAFEMPDRTEWLNAQDKFQKSIKSAVYGGCTYVNFHSCLREWLELFLYAGQRMEVTMCDHRGRLIRELFKNNPKLAEWFVSTTTADPKKEFYKRKYDFAYPRKYGVYILGEDEIRKIERRVNQDIIEKTIRDVINKYKTDFKGLVDEIAKKRKLKQNEILALASQLLQRPTKKVKIEDKEIEIEDETKPPIFISQLESNLIPEQDKIAQLRQIGIIDEDKLTEDFDKNFRKEIAEAVKSRIQERWHEEVIRGGLLDDVYVIMANDMFLNKDPLWEEMVLIYKDVLDYYPEYKYNPNDPDWLLKILDKAQTDPSPWSLKFKEFYYGVVAAKYLQGHVVEAVKWMNDEKEGLKKMIRDELAAMADPKEREEQEKILFENIKKLRICFETPDARNPELGGRYMLWHPKQIYLAVKHTRRVLEEDKKNEGLKTHSDKIFMIIDWEHVATQGVDPFHEADDFVKCIKEILKDENAGDLILGVHSNYPSPLQPHKPIEIADRPVIYKLLYKLREIGFGKNIVAYLLFERGGGENPFKASVIALRAIADQLEKDTKPEDLPLEFFALPEGTRDYARQRVVILEHALDPIKGMLKVPEEDYTFLGTAALKGGKTPEQWKKEELR